MVVGAVGPQLVSNMETPAMRRGMRCELDLDAAERPTVERP